MFENRFIWSRHKTSDKPNFEEIDDDGSWNKSGTTSKKNATTIIKLKL